MAYIFDSHAHYDNPKFDSDREQLLTEILPSKNVGHVINSSYDINSSLGSIKLAEKYDYFYATVGVHPQDAGDVDTDYLERLEYMSKHPKVIAMGEMGLDYYYEDSPPRDVQIKVFRKQLELANALLKPVVIHNRDSHKDMLEILKEYKPHGVMHCFSGSVEVATEVINLGMYIGLTGVVTFKNAKNAVAVARDIPIDRLLIETDCPYMAPEPYRGKRCDSSMLCEVAQKIAEIRGISADEVLRITAENTKRLYSIK